MKYTLLTNISTNFALDEKEKLNMAYQDDFREIERRTRWTAPRVLFMIVVLMVIVYGLGFLATGGDLAIYRFWAPKQEDAKRVVFQNTQSYVQGKAEYINQLRLSYGSAEGAQKELIRRTILTEASTVDVDKLPEDEQAFLRSIGGVN